MRIGGLLVLALVLTARVAVGGDEVQELLNLLPSDAVHEAGLGKPPTNRPSPKADLARTRKVLVFTTETDFDASLAFLKEKGGSLKEANEEGSPSRDSKKGPKVFQDPDYRIAVGEIQDWTVRLESKYLDLRSKRWIDKTTVTFSQLGTLDAKRHEGKRQEVKDPTEVLKKYLPPDAKLRDSKGKGPLRYQTAVSFEGTLAALKKAGVKMTEQRLPARISKSAKGVQPRMAIGTVPEGYSVQLSSHLFKPKKKEWTEKTTVTFKMNKRAPVSQGGPTSGGDIP